MGSCDSTAPAAGRCATSGDRYGDKLNPGSVMLSGEMMLRSKGWTEAADAIIKAMEVAIGNKKVTQGFARLMEGATEIKCSEFVHELIKAL